MGPLGVVKTKPIGDHPFRHKAIRHLMQIDRLVFEAAPQPFDEDVIHGDRHASTLERPIEGQGGELTALIRVEDLRFAVSGQGFIQALKAEPGIHGIG